MKKHWVLGLIAVSACSADRDVDSTSYETEVTSTTCDTTQIFGTPQHGGKTCTPPAALNVVASVVNDPSVQQEHDDFGFLAVHYGAALTSGSWAYVPGKSGYTTLDHPETQTWSVQALQWVGATLTPRWTYASDWKPVDALFPFQFSNGYEQLFQPVLVPNVPRIIRGGLYVPGASGRITKLDPTSGSVIATIDPLAGTPFSGDENTTISSSLVSDGRGDVAYTVTAWTPGGNLGVQPRTAWLVVVGADDRVRLQPWAAIASAAVGVKQELDQCPYFSFQASPSPEVFPPSPDAPAFTAHCTRQRPSLNAPPTFTTDGKILLTSTANNAIMTSYLIAIDATTLAPAWAASLAGHILDGCGVLIPFDSIDSDFGLPVCPTGTHVGIYPFTNEPIAGRENGLMETAPVVAPDGSIYLAAYTGGYDNNRSHLFRFSASGQFLGVHDYAWETSPYIWIHDGGFSLVLDDSSTTDGTDPDGVFAVARLSPTFEPQARTVFQNRDVESNNVLDGQPPVDTEGNLYTLHADGRVSKVDASGQVVATVDLPKVSMEALSAETAWGRDGLGRSVLYVPFAGRMWVIGEGSDPTSTGAPTTGAHPSRLNGHRRGSVRH